MLGAHAGIINFTVGQRKGLGLSTGAPLYVVRLDAERRRVVVGPREALRTSRIVLRDVNWLGDGERYGEAVGREVFVKVRSTRPPQAGWLRRNGDAYEVELIDGEDGVSPGQACVFYDAGEGQARVLGGGFIKSAVAAADRAATREVSAWCPPRAASRRRLTMGDIDKQSVERAYARWAPVYDLVFGAVFDAGRCASIAAAEARLRTGRRTHPRSRRRHRHFAARLLRAPTG